MGGVNMNTYAEMLKRIEKKEQEARELEIRLREARAYILGMQEAVKLLPRAGDDGATKVALRPGSDVAKVRDFLARIARPLYIGEILRGIGKEDTHANRASLAGSLGPYVRRGEIFTRPEPNTFGLVEFQSSGEENQVLDEGIASTATEADNGFFPEATFDDSDPFADQ